MPARLLRARRRRAGVVPVAGSAGVCLQRRAARFRRARGADRRAREPSGLAAPRRPVSFPHRARGGRGADTRRSAGAHAAHRVGRQPQGHSAASAGVLRQRPRHAAVERVDDHREHDAAEPHGRMCRRTRRPRCESGKSLPENATSAATSTPISPFADDHAGGEQDAELLGGLGSWRAARRAGRRTSPTTAPTTTMSVLCVGR